MYKITWEKETGGVLLHSRIVDGTLGISPRPVFWEELDLLKLNELGWKYPHTEEPLFDNVQSTLISVDSSSQISRFSASSGVSPASILPPGNSHQSFHSPYPCWVANILSSSQITAAATSILFIAYSILHCFYTNYASSLLVEFNNCVHSDKLMTAILSA